MLSLFYTTSQEITRNLAIVIRSRVSCAHSVMDIGLKQHLEKN